jgi:hypothetical protein
MLVVFLANHGVSGDVRIPTGRVACARLIEEARVRLDTARRRLMELAECRTNDLDSQSQIVDLMMRWFIRGRPDRYTLNPHAQDISVIYTEQVDGKEQRKRAKTTFRMR